MKRIMALALLATLGGCSESIEDMTEPYKGQTLTSTTAPCDTMLFHDLTADPIEMKWMVNCGGEWEPLEGPQADWLEDWLSDNYLKESE